MALVDIILPTYNCEKYIEETLDSITNQDFKDWKLIIIDDASNDSTKNLIKKYLSDKRVSLLELKKNKGVGFCRNFGIRYSNSKYIAFIDSDDVWNPHKLEKQVIFMEDNGLDFTYTNFTKFSEADGEKKRKKEIILPDEFTYKSFIRKTSICTSSMIIRKEKIGLTKFINTKVCEDYFFKCKLLKSCNSAKNINKNLVMYRISKKSLQSNKLRNFYWVWYINSKYNKMNIFENIFSLFWISINSLKNYGFK